MSRKLISILGVSSIAGVLGWAASSAPLGSTGGGRDSHPGKGYGYGGKVVICHHTHSAKHPWVQIRISNRAVAAHLVRHGDFVVTLNAPCPPKPGLVTTASPKNHGHSASHASSNSQSAQGKDNSGGHGNNGHHGKS